MHLTAHHAFTRRDTAGLALSADSPRIAEAGRDLADRFRRGGKLILFGEGTDAQHIAVEFVHPVIMGRRSLPAMALGDGATAAGSFSHQLRHWAEPADSVLAVSASGRCPGVLDGLAAAGELGLLTVALVGDDGRAVRADHVIAARSTDPAVVKEIHVTVYHVLWDLVHLFLDRRGADDGPA
ncbi:SIS domain-containing protein [Streptosporangium sp. KLBMP 9127]|nr:SIS domain-containing protein [Streptosporangium sp. KLBMP 9127]